MPQLPDDSVDLNSAKEPEDLVPGLEESRGALYEIGVSDDGTLVGLTRDELDESIKTLRVMAASLGCSVEVVRMVIVGDCEWIDTIEQTKSGMEPTEITREDKLWVAEAFVTPNLGMEQRDVKNGSNGEQLAAMVRADAATEAAVPSKGSSRTPQLRVTFTGPTTSGKSSLLGTLSTGTLDNGRGKSRLSLLKHRHEVASGVTSSIAQELIGYKEKEILNYSQSNIESWVDIHDCAEGGRLVFVSDSGGHPRYRRTVLRGLMNWAPHWSMLCIAADDGETAATNPGATSSAQDTLGAAAAGVDLVNAHLTLSLKLDVPLAVVVTKLDLASRGRLQKTMSKILTAIKESGRVPKIVQPDQKQHADLLRIPREDYDKVQGVVESIVDSGSLTQIVPIVLTSSVKGTGIGLLHALLEGLPLPPTPTSRDFVGMALNPEQPKCLFHIDDTFSLPASYSAVAGSSKSNDDQGVVVSGYLRFGNLSIGDKIVVGPFPPEDDDSRGFASDDKASPGNYGLSISHPSSAELAKVAMKNAVSASTIVGEWHRARIVSIRNLRLPVRNLEAGQAGTIGLVFEPRAAQNGHRNTPQTCASPRIRRGMVLAIPSKHMLDTGLSLQAASGFTATFHDPGMESLAVGSFVNVYVASVRAAARVRGISHHHHRQNEDPGTTATEDIDDVFNLNEEMEDEGNGKAPQGRFSTEVFLELLHNREWVELGSPVMLLEGGSQDRSGLEGYVGRIIEIVD
jgi:GTPase